MNCKYEAGTIFAVPNEKKTGFVYWKITNAPRSNQWSHSSYPVVKCNKNGLEFKETNGYSINFVDNLNSENIIKVVEVGTKANIDEGIESGVKKRRIEWLKNAIKEYQKELKELEG